MRRLTRYAHVATVRIVMAVVVTGALTTMSGCGIRATGIVEAGDAPVARALETDNLIDFLKDGKLVQVMRPGLPSQTVSEVLDQLAAGPNGAERRRGLTSEVGRSDVSLAWFEQQSQDELRIRRPSKLAGELSRAAKAQIACTAARIPGIERIVLENRRNETITCDDFRDLQD